ncbi:F-box protein [Medicago truncatula]|uniref:F-box protein n=1 Tax=Medicago truncatula TaxID=3880 RepID=A0A072TSH9_MEDTR|nr:F-box protein [Medicago truncatula]
MSDPPAQPNAESPVSLSDNLIAEIISFSDVKSLMQMRCVCKSWRSIISDPKFVKLHLKRSARNPYLTLIRDNIGKKLIPFPVRRLILLENPWILLPDNLCYESQDICYPSKDMEFRNAIGFCNGLFCLICYAVDYYVSQTVEFWFRFWNPVVLTMSKRLAHFIMSKKLAHILSVDMYMAISKHCKFC